MQDLLDAFDLDPRLGVSALTARLRELIEDARDDDERARLRAAWEELTTHPERRLAVALAMHPESRAPLSGEPAVLEAAEAPAVTLADLAPRPSVATALAAAGVVADVDAQIHAALSAEA